MSKEKPFAILVENGKDRPVSKDIFLSVIATGDFKGVIKKILGGSNFSRRREKKPKSH